jgi:hypothetical protein
MRRPNKSIDRWVVIMIIVVMIFECIQAIYDEQYLLAFLIPSLPIFILFFWGYKKK